VSIKYTTILALSCLIIGLSLGYYTLPAKIVTNTITQTVVQVVHDTQQVIKDNTTTTIVKKVDGSIVTTIEDKNVTSNLSTEISDSKSQTKSEKVVSYSKNNLNLGVIGIYNFSTNRIEYGGYVTKQLLGPITIGIQATQAPSAGFMVGLSF
jgi:hypothetical protein